MDVASKVLIVGGVLSLAIAFQLGFVLSRARMTDPSREHPWLLNAHRVALQEGFMLLGLVFAVILSDLATKLETAAALLLVASAALQNASSVANWLQGVGDQFAERSLGYKLAATNAVLATAGLAILVVGVFSGL